MVTIIFQQDKGDKQMIHGNMKDHKYEVSGNKLQILTELTTLMHTLYEKEVLDKDELMQAAELATKSVDELSKDCADTFSDSITGKLINDAMSGNEAARDLLSLIMRLATDTL